MSRLGRLYKPAHLAAYLEQAVAALGHGFHASVHENGKEVASSGAANVETVVECRTLPLSFECESLGELIVCLDANLVKSDEDHQRLAKAADFLAVSLSEILKQRQLKRSLGAETLEQYRESAITHRAVLSLNQSMKLVDVAEALLNETRLRAKPDECGVVFVRKPEQSHFTLARSFGPLPPHLLMGIPASRLFQDVVKGGRTEIINDLHADPRWAGEVAEVSSILIAPLKDKDKVMGGLVLMGLDQAPPFTAKRLKQADTLATVAGIAVVNSLHFETIQSVLTALMQAMSTAIDSRDSTTAGHSHRVARYARLLALAIHEDKGPCKDISFTQDQIQEIYFAGLLHDVGKIGIREETLTKATRLPKAHMDVIGLRFALWGRAEENNWQEKLDLLQEINEKTSLDDDDRAVVRELAERIISFQDISMPALTSQELEKLHTMRGNLTSAEWEDIRTHPMESHRILQAIPFHTHFPDFLNAILQHHERLDGSGYPLGLKGDDIIMQGRILAVVDVFDAIRSKRHYKERVSLEKTLDILRREAGAGKLDKAIVEVFCEHAEAFEKHLPPQQAVADNS